MGELKAGHSIGRCRKLEQQFGLFTRSISAFAQITTTVRFRFKVIMIGIRTADISKQSYTDARMLIYFTRGVPELILTTK